MDVIQFHGWLFENTDQISRDDVTEFLYINDAKTCDMISVKFVA